MLRNADAFGPRCRARDRGGPQPRPRSGSGRRHGSGLWCNLARALRDLKAKGVWILGADAGGESLFEADVSGPVAWVLGAEGTGLRRLTREHCDRIVGIPMMGTVGSLNVAVASGICLYASRRVRPAAG
jgi:23S rRNA (guanosine2251-2'-O)-methyltransferase